MRGYLEVRAHERVVDNNKDLGVLFLGSLYDGLDVNNFEQRVGRRFEPNYLNNYVLCVSS